MYPYKHRANLKVRKRTCWEGPLLLDYALSVPEGTLFTHTPTIALRKAVTRESVDDKTDGRGERTDSSNCVRNAAAEL